MCDLVSRWPPVVLAVIPNLLSAARLVLGLAFAAVPVSWRLVVVVVAGATEFLDGAPRRLSKSERGRGGWRCASEEGPGAVLSHANGGVLPVGWAGKPWTRVPAATGQG